MKEPSSADAQPARRVRGPARRGRCVCAPGLTGVPSRRHVCADTRGEQRALSAGGDDQHCSCSGARAIDDNTWPLHRACSLSCFLSLSLSVLPSLPSGSRAGAWASAARAVRASGRPSKRSWAQTWPTGARARPQQGGTPARPGGRPRPRPPRGRMVKVGEKNGPSPLQTESQAGTSPFGPSTTVPMFT